MLTSVILFAGIVLIAPENAGVVAYKVLLVAIGGMIGFGLDRSIFPYARPHEAPTGDRAGIRRAIIVAAAILGVTQGL